MAERKGAGPHEHDHEPQGMHDLHGLLLELVRSVGLLHVVEAGPAGEVSASELFALHELDRAEGLSQQELATLLRLDKSTVSRLVAGLESRGLLVRERSPHNRRLVRLSLTARGRAAHRDVADSLHEHQRSVLAAMTRDERTALHAGLTGLLRALKATHEVGPSAGPVEPVEPVEPVHAGGQAHA